MYSTIKAKVADQTLTITSVPKLASGGANEIRVEVSFDAYWDGFGKTAIFYRKENQVYHVVMVNDVCVVPREVMAEAGRLYFGVMGAAGSSVRTTEVVALKVEQGAITGTVSAPLPDVYKQVLSEYGVLSARVSNLVAGGTVDGSELADVRVGADGKTYPSAGEAVRDQFTAATYPKKLDKDAWVQTPFEKQPFLYWDLLNGNTVIEQVEHPASYICGRGNLDALTPGAYVLKRGRLINEILLSATKRDYTALVYTDVAFTGNVYLMYSDFSGKHPYMVTTNTSFNVGWNVVDFEGIQAGTTASDQLTHGYHFLAVRVFPTEQATVELVNSIQFALVKDMKSILDAWLGKSADIVSKTNYDFVAWGDSLTQGAGGGGTTYINVLAKHFGATHYNGGAGGENPSLIACRAGANTFYIPANQIPHTPFTGEFEFGGGSLFTSSASANIPVQVNGESYTMIRDSSGKYAISGLTDVAPYPRPVTLTQQHSKGKITVIWIGTNSGRTYEEIYPWVDRIIATLPNENYIVLGLTYHTDAAALVSTNAHLKERYGSKFIDIRDKVLRYGLAQAGLTATTEDQVAISSGLIPPSLLNDNVHFNATGYTVIGGFLIDKVYALGYDKYL